GMAGPAAQPHQLLVASRSEEVAVAFWTPTRSESKLFSLTNEFAPRSVSTSTAIATCVSSLSVTVYEDGGGGLLLCSGSSSEGSPDGSGWSRIAVPAFFGASCCTRLSSILAFTGASVPVCSFSRLPNALL